MMFWVQHRLAVMSAEAGGYSYSLSSDRTKSLEWWLLRTIDYGWLDCSSLLPVAFC